MFAGKREGFWRRRKENKFKSVETYHKCKNWPNIPLFIVRVLSAYFLLFFYFIIIEKGTLFTLSLNK